MGSSALAERVSRCGAKAELSHKPLNTLFQISVG